MEYVTPVVALPAILTLSYQAIDYLVHGLSDEVTISLGHVDEDDQRVVFAVSNTGGRNAILRSADVVFDAKVVAQNAIPRPVPFVSRTLSRGSISRYALRNTLPFRALRRILERVNWRPC